MTDEQRRRDSCRSYANVYRRRGHLIPEPREVCGGLDVEMHHDDYTKPLEVRWLCKGHHRHETNRRRVARGLSMHQLLDKHFPEQKRRMQMQQERRDLRHSVGGE